MTEIRSHSETASFVSVICCSIAVV